MANIPITFSSMTLPIDGADILVLVEVGLIITDRNSHVHYFRISRGFLLELSVDADVPIIMEKKEKQRSLLSDRNKYEVCLFIK